MNDFANLVGRRVVGRCGDRTGRHGLVVGAGGVSHVLVRWDDGTTTSYPTAALAWEREFCDAGGRS